MKSDGHTKKWVMLSVAYLALIAGFIPYMGWTISLPTIVDDLSISYGQAGFLSSVTALVGGVCMLVAGPACTRWGAKKVVLLGLVAAVVSQLLFASADDYSMALVSRIVGGVAVGLLWVGTYTAAVNWFQSYGKTDHAVGVMMTGDGAGFLVTLYAFALAFTAFGWRTGLSIEAVFLAAVIVASFLFLKDAPAPSTDTHQEAVTATSRPEEGMLRALMQRNVLLAVMFWIGGVGFFSLVASWMPTILIENAGWSQTVAGFTSSMFAWVGVGGALVAGFLGAKLRNRRGLLVLSCGLLMTVSIAGLGLSLASGNFGLVFLFIPLIGVAVYGGEVTALAVAIDSVRERFAGAVNGVVLGAGFCIGGVAYPYALGSIRDATGSYAVGFVAVTIVTLVVCGLAQVFMRGKAPVAQETDLAPDTHVPSGNPSPPMAP